VQAGPRFKHGVERVNTMLATTTAAAATMTTPLMKEGPAADGRDRG